MSDQQDKSAPEERRTSKQSMEEITNRLDRGDERFELLEANLKANTTATQQIAENTAGLVRLTNELEAGTKFLCRLAMAIRFVLKEIVEPFWKPALVCAVAIFYMTHDHQLPQWIAKLLNFVMG